MVSTHSRYEPWLNVERRRALFLDRDGTIIEDAHYLRDPAKIRFLPGALAVLRACAEAGYALVVVSNQSGVARGYLTHAELTIVHRHLVEAMAAYGVSLTGAYYCEHGPDAGCPCRKPAPGLILDAARELGLELASSWTVGDKPRDCEAGLRAGCKVILLGSDREAAKALPADVVVAESWASIGSLLLADRAVH